MNRSDLPPEAPPGKIWRCTACGKRSRDPYGHQAIDRGWDVSCFVNRELVDDEKPRSIVRENAEKDPNYLPYCMRCPGLVRMKRVEPFYWRCDCGAEHDEREKA